MTRIKKALQQEIQITKIINEINSLVLCGKCGYYVTPRFDENGLICVVCKREKHGTSTENTGAGESD